MRLSYALRFHRQVLVMNSKSQDLPMSFDSCGSIALILSTAPAYRAQKITIDKSKLGNSYPKLENM